MERKYLFGCLLAASFLHCLPSAAAEGASGLEPCPACPPMAVVPAGRFRMGDDAGFSKFEKPAVEIAIPRRFALGRTEVTFEQWGRCIAEGACRGGQDDHEWGRGKRPVINVTWNEAQAFAAWVGRKGRLSCRLPTEAEWEYAARAGTTTAFWWGDGHDTGYANCRDCRGEGEVYGTTPAASFPANPWGLSDMNGNVWEWVADCWRPSHDDQPADGSAIGGTCGERVIKGGSWYYYSAMSRPAARSKNDVGIGSYNIGFRVLCELP